MGQRASEQNCLILFTCRSCRVVVLCFFHSLYLVSLGLSIRKRTKFLELCSLSSVSSVISYRETVHFFAPESNHIQDSVHSRRFGSFAIDNLF